MALMTSSSGTSSTVPRKLVSRRSMRMARLPSALPRSELISCRRSTSLSGRKSIDVLLSRYRPARPPKDGRNHDLSRQSRQFSQQKVDALIDACFRDVGRHYLAAAFQHIRDLVLFKEDAD